MGQFSCCFVLIGYRVKFTSATKIEKHFYCFINVFIRFIGSAVDRSQAHATAALMTSSFWHLGDESQGDSGSQRWSQYGQYGRSQRVSWTDLRGSESVRMAVCKGHSPSMFFRGARADKPPWRKKCLCSISFTYLFISFI